MDKFKGYVDDVLNKYHFYFRYYSDAKEETFFMTEYDFSINPELLHTELPPEEAYPIGTFLTITSRILSDIISLIEEGGKDPSDLIREILDRHLPETEEIKDSMDAIYVFIMFKLLDDDAISWRKSEIEEIEKLIDFIEICSLNTKNCNKAVFDTFLAYSKAIVPRGEKLCFDLFMSSREYEGGGDNLLQVLKQGMFEKSYMKKFYEIQGKDYQKSVEYQTSIYYKLNTIHEFILIMLQILFDERKVIKGCEHCLQYFVPAKRSDEKYCTLPSPENKSRDCKAQAKLKRQLDTERSSNSKIIHKRIRTKLSARYRYVKSLSDEEYNNRDKTLNTFIIESEKIRDYFRDHNYTHEKEYIDWMQNFYKNRYDIDKYGYSEDTIRIIRNSIVNNAKNSIRN